MDQEEQLQRWQTEMKKGFAKPFTLLVLAEKPTYPYQLTKTIVKMTRGLFTIAGSNIYPILRNLEEDGFINASRDEKTKKKYYSLNDKGKDFLIHLRSAIKEFTAIIEELF